MDSVMLATPRGIDGYGHMSGTPPSSTINHSDQGAHVDVCVQADLRVAGPLSYESEDEGCGGGSRRRRGCGSSIGCEVGCGGSGSGSFSTLSTRRSKRGTPLYSKQDIREQYCITDRQLLGLERRGAGYGSSGAGFFGCLSEPSPCATSRASLLSACVRRRAPSDENLAEAAPLPRRSRRLRPSVAPSPRQTHARLRPLISQSSEHLGVPINGSCPAHHVPPPPPPPPTTQPPRTKHVSFARSHTLTSFDDAVVGLGGAAPMTAPLSSASLSTPNQERLIDGKKAPVESAGSTLSSATPTAPTATTVEPKVVLVEKLKRAPMKTQATQTEVCLGRKPLPLSLALSPRTVHRVRMVSQGAQTNGMIGPASPQPPRLLMKSLSEAGRFEDIPMKATVGTTHPISTGHSEFHEPLQRTQSEEPPRSPRLVFTPSTPRYKEILIDFEPCPTAPRKTSIPHESSIDHLPCDECYSGDGEDIEEEDDESSDGGDLGDDRSPEHAKGSMAANSLGKRIGFGPTDSLDDEFHENLIYHGLLRKRSVSLEDTTLVDPDVPAFRRDRLRRLRQNRSSPFVSSDSLTIGPGEEADIEDDREPDEEDDEDDKEEDDIDEVDEDVCEDEEGDIGTVEEGETRDQSDNGAWDESQRTVLLADSDNTSTEISCPSKRIQSPPTVVESPPSAPPSTQSLQSQTSPPQTQQQTSLTVDTRISFRLESGRRISSGSSTRHRPLRLLREPDVSEHSTTDDYATATENNSGTDTSSRRSCGDVVGLPPTQERMEAEGPVTTGAGGNGGGDASSFESACSLARDESLSPQRQVVETPVTTAAPTAASRASTPSGDASSSSGRIHSFSLSASYSVEATNQSEQSVQAEAPQEGTAPQLTRQPATTSALPLAIPGSVSDDDPSGHCSSSGYYESPLEDEKSLKRRQRREQAAVNAQAKRGMRLEFAPEEQIPSTEKSAHEEQVRCSLHGVPRGHKSDAESASSDDLNEGNNAVSRRQRRGRRTPGSRSPMAGPASRQRRRSHSGDEAIIPVSTATLGRRRASIPVRSPEKEASSALSPTNSARTVGSPLSAAPPGGPVPGFRLSPHAYTRSHARSPETTGLKALSAESLRSVSPGSDSVFYSETVDHAGVCHHCGREAPSVSMTSPSGRSTRPAEGNGSQDIVQPPADFADSPDGLFRPSSERPLTVPDSQPTITQTPRSTRLYKKAESRRGAVSGGAGARARSEERHRESRERARLRTQTRSSDLCTSLEELKMGRTGSTPSMRSKEPSTSDGDADLDPDEVGVYAKSFRAGRWLYIGDVEEVAVWQRPERPSLGEDEGEDADDEENVRSTSSERDFRHRYQAITHRMVHRKASGEMYRRLSGQLFESDKVVTVKRVSGEFGFRIHGSRPVVVSAIEPNTPAESSGLEVGDILVSVNGLDVLETSHSDVIKIAHAGSDTLKLEVARTCNVLTPTPREPGAGAPVYSGYLWRQTSNSKWRRRWFCLKRDNTLYHYRSQAETLPLGASPLAGYRVTRLSSTDINRSFGFRLIGDGAPITLAAADEKSATEWLAVLGHALRADLSEEWLEIGRRNLKLAPVGMPQPDCSGSLSLLCRRPAAGWRKRYCVLKDACLYIYTDVSSDGALGMMCLHGYRVHAASASTSRRAAFELVPPEKVMRHIVCCAESDIDKRRWIVALEYSIDRWIKVR